LPHSQALPVCERLTGF